MFAKKKKSLDGRYGSMLITGADQLLGQVVGIGSASDLDVFQLPPADIHSTVERHRWLGQRVSI